MQGGMKRDKKTGIMYRVSVASSPDAVLLLVHGLGAHTGRWKFLSGFFLENNMSSYAIELKGFGKNAESPGHIDSFKTYYNDIFRLNSIIADENPGKKVFLIGESMGALISLSVSLERPELFGGLVCISPAFVSKMKLSALDYAKIFLPLLYNPKKQHEMPFDSAMCTRDVDYQREMDSDEREHRFATSKLLLEIARAQVRVIVHKKRIKDPVLFLIAGEDKLVDPGVSKQIFGGLGSKDKTIVDYPAMYHALSIDTGREKVFADILGWIKERIFINL